MRNLKLLLFLLILCVVAYVVLQVPSLFSSETRFNYANVQKINRIEISRDTMCAHLLKTKDGDWLVENKDVNATIVENLIYAIEHQQVQYPMPAASLARANELLKTAGCTLRAYSGNSKKLDVTICAMDTVCIGLVHGKKNPFVIYIPGKTYLPSDCVNVNAAFYFNNVLFKYLPGDIKEISVENYEKPEQSFKIFQKNGNQLLLFDTYNNDFVNSFNSEKAKQYLSYFNGVEHCGLANLTLEQETAIKASKPLYTLTLLADNEKKSIKVIPIALSRETEKYGQMQTIDTDNCYLLLDENQAIVNEKWVNVDILLTNISDFVDK